MSRASATVVSEIRDGVRSRVAPTEADLADEFTRSFLAHAPAGFFTGRSVDTLASLCVSAWDHLKRSRPDRVDVEVIAPEEDSAPWESPTTLIRASVSERPFVVDSIREYLRAEEIPVERLLHPVLRVVRDADGVIEEVGPPTAPEPHEALVHCEVAPVNDVGRRQEIAARLHEVLEDVVYATEAFGDMIRMASETAALLDSYVGRTRHSEEEIREVQDFLRWLRRSFIFLGYRSYSLTESDAGPAVGVDAGSGLGILGQESQSGYVQPVPLQELRPELRERVSADRLLIINKTNAESRVHRRVRMDYVGIKLYDEQGRIAGERRFVGLFTSRAYAEDAERIPILRRKLAAILESAGWVPGSHDYKEAVTIFNSMPKEELFLATAEEIGRQIETILTRYDTQQVKVTLRRDAFGRGVSIMVVLPRERYSGRARRALQAEFLRHYQGTLLNFHLVLGGGDQARLHFYIAVPQERVAALDPERIEQIVQEMIRTWGDELGQRLTEEFGATEGHRLAERWSTASSPEYQAATTPTDAVADLRVILDMEESGRTIDLRMSNEPSERQDIDAVTRLRLYLRGERLVLSDFMPILENAGLRVISMSPFETQAVDASLPVMIYVFAVQDPQRQPLDLERTGELLTEALLAARAGDAQSDSLNALILTAGMTWREVDVLRAYAEYAFQLKVAPSRLSLSNALRSHPTVARLLVAMFRARFDPDAADSTEARSERMQALREALLRALDDVTSLNDDRTLRRLLTLVDATARTNYYLHGGNEPTVRAGGVPYISFKFLSELLQPLVRSRLRAEVWVHSVRMGGIHMRRGKVSRGGLRHSDRPDDFRTEVLGLVRTQSVKNAVIVPAGSKGGFITRRHFADQQEQAAEVEAQYRAFIRGLLDITDNLVDGEVVRPDALVVHDEPDPYLVVAADKGTARFSDVANSVAAEYGFWLDDAFASGGSVGYDHKEVGITARGAWECVRRHFREMGRDTQTEPFTVVGVGDMSGDVFGNGMLLSRQIRLIAAFDHRHIFVDPDPDAERSYVERERLFKLGRSSWDDYDRDLISRGGFVVSRGVKSVHLSPEARTALGLPEDTGPMDGESLIRAVLRAPVDLLWNGGIGTYVKATDETHAAAGDSTNDAVRVDAAELRCKVLGEGGNLGLTQRARIEFALCGGRCNTDAIDNSGGVELSDREVNLKILLNGAVADGRLDRAGRNDLLLELTDAVTEKVLHDNRSQSLAVSLDEIRAGENLEDFHGFMLDLERAGVMDRASEALPLLEVLMDRRQRGQKLTRPELSVLLAYAKLSLKQELLDSRVPDDRVMGTYLSAYFPAAAMEVAGEETLAGHRLSREIIATELANDMVDLMGAAFVFRLVRDTGHTPAEVARGWFIAARLCGAMELRQRLEALEGVLPSDVIYRWLLGLARVLERTTRWVLSNVAAGSAAAPVIGEYLDGLSDLRGNFASIVAGEERDLYEARVAEMQKYTSESDLAASLITLRFLDQLLEILKTATDTGQAPQRVGRAYYLASELMAVPRVRQAIFNAAGESRWEQRAARVLDEDLSRAHRHMTVSLLAAGDADESVETLLGRLRDDRAPELAAYQELLEDIASDEAPSLAAMMVAVRELTAQRPGDDSR
ncbi:MAG TPA: NAD-glutamate dehydrogenase [Longimicrobiales bacterium]|nr:NAD-glutamate dehydrogenase [Longimicrobiales bacterium]